MHVSESELRDRIVQVRHWRENADFSKLFEFQTEIDVCFPNTLSKLSLAFKVLTLRSIFYVKMPPRTEFCPREIYK